MMLKYISMIGLWTGCILTTACSNHSSKTNNTTRAADTEDHIAVDATVYESENLTIRKVAKHTYTHISFLHTESFGKVPCNGMIVVKDGEAIVFDTPADDESTRELLRYLTQNRSCDIKAIVATHFHADCVAGLNAFHEQGIPSYAHRRTIALLQDNENNPYGVPQHAFDDKLELSVGDKKAIAEFLGEGHTKDNIICYFPEDDALFGGCLIKEDGSGKGNLEDANVHAWSETVSKLKQEYPQTKLVIPGHGELGGKELLDYTIKLFDLPSQ